MNVIGHRRDGRPIYEIAGGDIEINLPSGNDNDNDNTTSSSTSSSSSSSSSSGSSAPKVDPIVQRRMAMFQTVYTQLWGEPATEAYLKAAANSGMNSWEFARQERNKPAWADTGAYKKKTEELATLLANLGLS